MAYIACVAVSFPGRVERLYWNTDAAGAFVLTQLYHLHDTVVIPRFGWWTSLWWLLATRHESNPEEPVAIAELIAAAWPDQKLLRSSALNRLHVALATLRQLGLQSVLQRRGDGYLLATRVQCAIRE